MQREKAIEELKRLIREQRARLDPALLRRAAEALQARRPASEPYDREAAAAVVETFLKHHDADGAFRLRLLEMLKKNSH